MVLLEHHLAALQAPPCMVAVRYLHEMKAIVLA